MLGIVKGASWTREVEYVVECTVVAGLADVFFDEFEAPIVLEMLDVGKPSSEEIVGGDDFVAMAEQGIAEMRAKEAGSSGDQGTGWIGGCSQSLGFCRCWHEENSSPFAAGRNNNRNYSLINNNINNS